MRVHPRKKDTPCFVLGSTAKIASVHALAIGGAVLGWAVAFNRSLTFQAEAVVAWIAFVIALQPIFGPHAVFVRCCSDGVKLESIGFRCSTTYAEIVRVVFTNKLLVLHVRNGTRIILRASSPSEAMKLFEVSLAIRNGCSRRPHPASSLLSKRAPDMSGCRHTLTVGASRCDPYRFAELSADALWAVLEGGGAPSSARVAAGLLIAQSTPGALHRIAAIAADCAVRTTSDGLNAVVAGNMARVHAAFEAATE